LAGSCADDSLNRSQLELLHRIIEFYFPFDDEQLLHPPRGIRPDSRWFFDEEFKQETLKTSREVVAELRSLAYAAKYCQGSCRIIRTSGKLRFAQMTQDMNEPEPSGRATIECLESGVKVFYLYPACAAGTNPTAAQQTAEEFDAFAKAQLVDKPTAYENLRLVALDTIQSSVDSGKHRWAGEYLSPILRWAFYECHEPKGVSRTLIASRSRGAAEFCAAPDEAADFESWFNTVVGSNTASHPTRRKKVRRSTVSAS
jgi:hypothetical protein